VVEVWREGDSTRHKVLETDLLFLPAVGEDGVEPGAAVEEFFELKGVDVEKSHDGRSWGVGRVVSAEGQRFWASWGRS